MLTLAAADTLAAVASAGSLVTMTVFGMELTAAGSTETYKVLAQLQLAAAAATIYTVPAGTTAFVKTITAINTDTSTQTFQLFRGGLTSAFAITPSITIPVNGCAIYEDGQGWKVHNNLGQVLGLGATGATGATGSSGAIGLQGLDGEPAADPLPAIFPTGSISRNMMQPDAKGWSFLGTATGATTTVGPIIWTGQYQDIMGQYVITGYNGGTPVGRLLAGAASISTTAANNGNVLMENAVVNNTSISVPGCPLATTLTAIARQGWFFISGASGSLKQVTIVGMNGNPAAGSAPVMFDARSFFSDLGTNLLLQRLQLTVYDTLTATAASAQTFNSGTFLRVWGRNAD